MGSVDLNETLALLGSFLLTREFVSCLHVSTPEMTPLGRKRDDRPLLSGF